jgi:uncharacterized protein (DUF1501 family)
MNLNRRDFIRGAAAVALPLTINGYSARAMGLSPVMESLGEVAASMDRVLVLVQLSGGNDGLNTVIPLDQYSVYSQVRANIAIPENRVLKLNNATGLHPAMAGMKTLFDEGKLAVIQGVTYPTPNQSHFRSTDIWLSGSAYNQYLDTGWAGRFLGSQYPNYPVGFPNAQMPDPLAIQISAVPSLALRDDTGSLGINLQDPDAFYRLVGTASPIESDPVANTAAGRQIAFLRQIQTQSQQYASTIKTAADKAKTNKVTYPAGNGLAAQLSIVARLIAGGLRTRVYMVSLGGFDTHANQVQAADRTIGSHATLLNNLSQAISSFQTDLQMFGLADKVIGMTFSEFGRRVASNVASGTDHGTAAPQFVFGAAVRGGIIGTNPSLTNLTNNNLTMQNDFRDIYASVLRQWFQVDSKQYGEVFSRDFVQLPLIKGTSTDVALANAQRVSTTGTDTIGSNLHNYPNPCQNTTTIEYTLQARTAVSLSVHDTSGAVVATVNSPEQSAGTYAVNMNVEAFPNGNYFYRLNTDAGTASGRMLVAR